MIPRPAADSDPIPGAPPESPPASFGTASPRPAFDPVPTPYGPEELALAHFAQAKDALVFGASTHPESYLQARHQLLPLLRQADHPYHGAAGLLWAEIHDEATEQIRRILVAQGALPPKEDLSSLEGLLGIAALRWWPDMATALLLDDYEDGERWALIHAGNIDQNTDFLALHLRALLLAPDVRESALEFMILLSAQACGLDQGRLCDSPTQRHLAAALATGEVHPDEMEAAARRLAEERKLSHAAAAELMERLRYAARRYAEIARNADESRFPALFRPLDSREKQFDLFFGTAEEETVRSRARDLLHDPEAMSAFCRKLARIAYIEEGRTLEERHRAEERLVLLGSLHAERLLSDPERTLADWLHPQYLIGAERDMILTLVAMEDLRSGGAAAHLLRGALQNPLFREEALGLMVEITFRNPPGPMEESLLEAAANRELGTEAEALAILREAAEETLGPTMAGWFMARFAERLRTYAPTAGIVPFMPATDERRRGLPFLASTLENRVQRSLDLLRQVGESIPFGLREAALHLLRSEPDEEVALKYRALLDPAPFVEILRGGDPGRDRKRLIPVAGVVVAPILRSLGVLDEAALREVARQLLADLVVLNEVIQRKDRARREHLREHLPLLLALRGIMYGLEAFDGIRLGARVPHRALHEQTLEIFRLKHRLLVQQESLLGALRFSSLALIRDWACDLMAEAFASTDSTPLLGLLRDPNAQVHYAAAALVREEPRFTPILLRMLEGDRPDRIGALAALEGTTDPETRRLIAQMLDGEAEVADAAIRALGGLETALLDDPDLRIAEAAANRLYKIDPVFLDHAALRRGLERMSATSTWTDDRVFRYRWAALLLARSQDRETGRAAFHAAYPPDTPLEESQRKAVLQHLALVEVHRDHMERGAAAAAKRI
ncbi:MAG: hypothetical protein KY468_06665, partial [Armatimonadetes bacterium]|nr:hypothetical protein [Armatimonadota bacterium]